MALLSPQQIAITGTTVTLSAANASDTAAPNDRAFWRVKNASGAAITATVVVPGTTFGQANPDVAVNVAATSGDVLIGPLVGSLADPATGLITLTTSAQTSVTSALVAICWPRKSSIPVPPSSARCGS